jgi:hypothetical protein
VPNCFEYKITSLENIETTGISTASGAGKIRPASTEEATTGLRLRTTFCPSNGTLTGPGMLKQLLSKTVPTIKTKAVHCEKDKPRMLFSFCIRENFMKTPPIVLIDFKSSVGLYTRRLESVKEFHLVASW